MPVGLINFQKHSDFNKFGRSVLVYIATRSVACLIWFDFVQKKVTSSASHFLPGKDLEPLLFQSFSI